MSKVIKTGAAQPVVGRAPSLRGAGQRQKEETLVAWFQRWCAGFRPGPAFQNLWVVDDELSSADKSQFQKNHPGVAPRSLRFGFRGQASGMVARVCKVAAVFCRRLAGLCAVPTAHPPDAAEVASFQGLVALAS